MTIISTNDRLRNQCVFDEIIYLFGPTWNLRIGLKVANAARVVNLGSFLTSYLSSRTQTREV